MSITKKLLNKLIAGTATRKEINALQLDNADRNKVFNAQNGNSADDGYSIIKVFETEVAYFEKSGFTLHYYLKRDAILATLIGKTSVFVMSLNINIQDNYITPLGIVVGCPNDILDKDMFKHIFTHPLSDIEVNHDISYNVIVNTQPISEFEDYEVTKEECLEYFKQGVREYNELIRRYSESSQTPEEPEVEEPI